MSTNAWQRIKEIFHSAIERPRTSRAAYLDETCDDTDVRREVDTLLRFHDEADDFIENPIAEMAEQLLAGYAEETPVGERLGPYEIVRELARGGMGAIYLATRVDDEYHKRVAVKLIRKEVTSPELIRRFRLERQVMASFDHPNIARLLDGGTTSDGQPYLVMEYIDGLPIDEYCEHYKLSIRQRLELFRQVCSALHFAHRHLVVHRDVKPANILVTAQGTPKLLDFGIAKLLNPDLHNLTLVPTTKGRQLMTPDYASPEQVRGEMITTASDIYSLGALLYELLTGRQPYRLDGFIAEIIQIICEQPPEPPSSVDPQLKGDLDSILLKALRKQPHQRYTSVEQFSEDLRLYLEGRPVLAGPKTSIYRLKKLLWRHRKALVAAALTVGLGLGVGLAATFWRPPETREVQVPRGDSALLSELATTYSGLGDALMRSVEGMNPQGRRAMEGHEVAETAYVKALRLREILAVDGPTDVVVRQEVARNSKSLADLKARRGELQEALELYQLASKIYQELLDADPSDMDLLAARAAIDGHRSDVLASLGDLPAALEAGRAQLVRITRVTTARVADVRRLDEEVEAHLRVAELLEGQGDASALESFRRGQQVLERLVGLVPTDIEKTHRLARLCHRIGGLHGDPDSALDQHERAVALVRGLALSHPSDPVFRLDLAKYLTSTADIYRAREDWTDAWDRYQESHEIQQFLVDQDPGIPRGASSWLKSGAAWLGFDSGPIERSRRRSDLLDLLRYRQLHATVRWRGGT